MYINIGIAPVLFLILMTLKLCGIITWSWWIVTMPLWLFPFIAGLILITLGFVLATDKSRWEGP